MIEYLFLGIVVLLIFFAFLIGTHKMLQVIIATALISLIVLGWSGFLDFTSYLIVQKETFILFGFGPESISEFLHSAKIATSILIFGGLLGYVLQYSSPLLVSASGFFDSKFIQLLLSPLAIFSMIVTLCVAVLGVDMFSIEFLKDVHEQFGARSFIGIFVGYLPILVFLQALVTLFLVFKKQRRIKHEQSYESMVAQEDGFDS